MKRILFFLNIGIFFMANSQQVNYITYPVYEGTDLGLSYSKERSSFKVWSPPAERMELRLYTSADASTPSLTFEMKKAHTGCWSFDVPGDKKGMFYTFRAYINGIWKEEVPDPYVKAVGVNGKRGAIVDPSTISPTGWQLDKSPITKKATDAIIYELHVRDASMSPSSGIKHKGQFLGLSEMNTHTKGGKLTGLSHIKELGITHVHLLPFFDYNSVDERKPLDSYNWGYDPLNYNTPEGSYATNPNDPASRILELKKMVMAFHANGVKVVMDAVYNHTGLTNNSYFNQLVPGYYYRQKKDGSFSDATACGNETASERFMMRKFMLESVLYWVKEYHIDGFRFDLMGVHDIKTMNLISQELKKIKPDILLYGEGWTAGTSPLPDDLRALKINESKLNGVAVFSDDIRDAIKGSVFDNNDRGFATGKPGTEESVKFGIIGAGQHPQIDYGKVNYSKAPYTTSPSGVINYAECHDNLCLWDKLAVSVPNATEAQRKEMHKLALSIVLTSQGIPFLHAGTEFLRTKHGVENSYKSPDSINEIDWTLKEKNIGVFNYVQALISMRKSHPAFRMNDSNWLQSHLEFQPAIASNFISYVINSEGSGDSWKHICVIFNGSENNEIYKLPTGSWKSYILNNKKNAGSFSTNEIKLSPYSATVLFQ